MFIGRTQEMARLQELYDSPLSHIAVVYGRRRIGKSALISRFAEGKPWYYSFEGIEGERTHAQIVHVAEALKRQTGDSILGNVVFPHWDAVFAYLTENLLKKASRRKKLILVFDELQWLAAGRGRLISLIKYYWDNHWKQHNVLLILCGSLASFMVQRVIHSKALYGRISLELLIKGLAPGEAAAFFDARRSREEVLKYLLVVGTVPRYLELVQHNRSFTVNMNRLFFSPQAVLKDEINRIFYSQFKEKTLYRAIVEYMQDSIRSLDDISRAQKISTGGGLKRYLTIMEESDIIRSYVSFGKIAESRDRRYTLSDEYLRFYFKYIGPNRETIDESTSARLFELLCGASFDIWLGLAFERFCLKHAHHIARILGFEDTVLRAGPYFVRGDSAFQIDLLYLRSDKVIVMCEIKFHATPVSTAVIPEIRRKIDLFPLPAGHSLETALISVHGPDASLHAAKIFDHHVTAADLLECEKK